MLDGFQTEHQWVCGVAPRGAELGPTDPGMLTKLGNGEQVVRGFVGRCLWVGVRPRHAAMVVRVCP